MPMLPWGNIGHPVVLKTEHGARGLVKYNLDHAQSAIRKAYVAPGQHKSPAWAGDHGGDLLQKNRGLLLHALLDNLQQATQCCHLLAHLIGLLPLDPLICHKG